MLLLLLLYIEKEGEVMYLRTVCIYVCTNGNSVYLFIP